MFLRRFLATACIAFSLATSLTAAESLSHHVQLSDDEKAAGWKLLFDGVNTTGWRGLGQQEFPSSWAVENGCLKCIGGSKNTAVDLVYDEKFDNFEFAFEWRFPRTKGNSGVKYRVQEQPGRGYAFGCEYQIMNDPNKSDKHSSGALYDLIAPEGKKLVPQDEFNQSRIVVQGNHVEHWLNGVKVVTADFGSEELKAAVAKSRFKNSDWGKKPQGYIVLQNHRTEVLFRNLKIRVLSDGTAK